MRVTAAFVLGLVGSILGLALAFFWYMFIGLTATPSQFFALSVHWMLSFVLVVLALVGASLSLAGKRQWAGWLLLASGLGGFGVWSFGWILSGALILIAALLAFGDKREGQSMRLVAFVLGLLGGALGLAVASLLSIPVGSSPLERLSLSLFGLAFLAITLALAGESLSNDGKRKWTIWLLGGSVLVGFGAVTAVWIIIGG